MKSVTKREHTIGLPLPVRHSMYHPMGPEADHRLAGSTPDFTNPSCRAFPSFPQPSDPRTHWSPNAPCLNARLPQTTRPVGLIVCPEPQAPQLPSAAAPPLSPDSPHSSAPGGARVLRSSPAHPRSPPRRAARSPRPQMLHACTPAPQGSAAPSAPSLRLAPQTAPPGGQATPRLLGLPGSSDHPAPAPPRELFRRPQGSLGMLRQRRLE